jgi:hypothetical protein
MLRPYPRFLAAGLAAATAVTALTIAHATAATATAKAAVRTASTTSAGDSTELLLNGDRLIPAGPHAFRVLRAGPGSGFAAATVTFGLDGTTYDVPAAALPYLGRGLDFSLFDVALLPHTGKLPVTLSYQGAKAPALPGVSVTRAGAGTATGYLTPASARVFYAALIRQFVRDHATGAYGTDGMFADGTAIRLAGTPATPVPRTRPRFPMHTLTVHGTALNGKPDTGDTIVVLNMDNFDYFSDPNAAENIFYHGSAKFSVPAGHYLAFALYTDSDSQGNPVDDRWVTIPGFTVTGDTTISTDERTATTAESVSVPNKQAIMYELDWTLSLTDNAHHLDWYELSTGGQDFGTYVNQTTQHPLAGSLHALAGAYLVSPGVGPQYTYNVSFAGPADVIGKQTYVANASNLATIPARYYSDSPYFGNSGVQWRYPVYPFDAQGVFPVPSEAIPAPGQQTEYVSAGNPALFWATTFYGSNAYAGTDYGVLGGQQDATRTFTPGQQATDNWNAYPLHPQLDASVLGSKDLRATLLSAARAGDTLSFHIWPFGDNTPGHVGMGFAAPYITGTFELDRNGVKIASGNAAKSPVFNASVPVSPASSVYRLTLNANRTISPFVLSTRTSTMWTWRSAHESGTVLPAGWTCPGTTKATQECASQSLMTLDYNVAGMKLNGAAPAGAQVVGITPGYQQLSVASPVKSVSASFSVNGGTTWQSATVKGSGTSWAASFNAPAGSKVSLKVTATGKNGSAITDTVWDAYAVSKAAATAGYRPAACGTPRPAQFSCDLLYSPQTPAKRAAAAGIPAALAGPAGWGATDIAKAYRLPVTRRGGTVAVVDAYDTPKLATYLNAYRKQYGLPPCTTASGCLRKVNENGQASPLAPDGTGSGWDLETTLDADMISAACPKCHILVVEGTSPSYTDLATAEDTAARLGAVAVSNSYGGRESGYSQTYAAAYSHPGHAIVASAGDSGYTAAGFPANLATVTAVGGTQMVAAHNARGYSEAVWNLPGHVNGGAGGSGCSAYVAKPAWQRDTDCPGRTVADVSALAMSLAIYNTDYAAGGWLQVGGTSAASPIIAGVYALAGNTASIKPGYEYAHPGGFYDIITGNNDWWSETKGKACGYDYLCVAKPGYDAPTGLGTPDGIGGF